MKILYSSADLHTAIKRVLGSSSRSDRRLAIVAYIGAGAPAFLPNPAGLQIVCAMQPGATSAEALIRLRRKGATIRQSSNLHMKVYSSSSRGAIVCSANASGRALGRQGLKEAGIWLPPGALDVDRLLRYVKPRPISNADLKALASAADRITAAVPRPRSEREPEVPSLAEWLASEDRKPAKLGWFDFDGDSSQAAKLESSKQYGKSEPSIYLDCGKGHLRQGDWVLQFNADTGLNAGWMYVDFVVKVARTDTKAYNRRFPYQAVQVHSSRRYPDPPFLLDVRSRKAIVKAAKTFGKTRFDSLHSAIIPVRFKTALLANIAKDKA